LDFVQCPALRIIKAEKRKNKKGKAEKEHISPSSDGETSTLLGTWLALSKGRSLKAKSPQFVCLTMEKVKTPSNCECQIPCQNP
jgi:hypothetical protein